MERLCSSEEVSGQYRGEYIDRYISSTAQGDPGMPILNGRAELESAMSYYILFLLSNTWEGRYILYQPSVQHKSKDYRSLGLKI